MATWFERKVRYDKLQENTAAVKKVTESFLVDALSFTEAEARIIEERTPFISGEFSVSAVKRTKLAEIFFDESDAADKFYQVKYQITTIDDRGAAAGKPAQEKKISILALQQAADFEDAVKSFNENMKGTLADYDIVAVSETMLLDVYPAKLGGE